MSSFISDYLYAQGTSKVPVGYHQWCCLSMLAATVADRVWLERAPGRLVRPNLYVMLIGPSGVGKGDAMKEAASLAAPILGADIFYGRITAAGLRDRLGKPKVDRSGMPVGSANHRIWLVQEELALCIGTDKAMADEIIAMLVGIYSGNPAPLRDRTRTGGEVLMQNPISNWLCGTTAEWLAKAVSPDAVAGGLSRRLCAVEGEYSSVRLPDPIYPDDRPERLNALRHRLAVLAGVEGPFVVTPGARDIFVEWFENRQEPEDPMFRPWWETQDELVYKLAMLLALADAPELVIEAKHMALAQAWSHGIQDHVVNAINYAAMAAENAGLAYARMLIKSRGWVDDRWLAQRLAGRGILAKTRHDYMQTLIDSGEVLRQQNGPRKGVWWEWKGRLPVGRTRRPPPPDEEATP